MPLTPWAVGRFQSGNMGSVHRYKPLLPDGELLPTGSYEGHLPGEEAAVQVQLRTLIPGFDVAG